MIDMQNKPILKLVIYRGAKPVKKRHRWGKGTMLTTSCIGVTIRPQFLLFSPDSFCLLMWLDCNIIAYQVSHDITMTHSNSFCLLMWLDYDIITYQVPLGPWHHDSPSILFKNCSSYLVEPSSTWFHSFMIAIRASFLSPLEGPSSFALPQTLRLV